MTVQEAIRLIIEIEKLIPFITCESYKNDCINYVIELQKDVKRWCFQKRFKYKDVINKYNEVNI